MITDEWLRETKRIAEAARKQDAFLRQEPCGFIAPASVIALVEEVQRLREPKGRNDSASTTRSQLATWCGCRSHE